VHEGIRKFKEMGLLCLFLDARGRLGLTISADRRTHRLSFLHNALFSSNCFVCLCFFKKLSYLDERRKVRTEHQFFFFLKKEVLLIAQRASRLCCWREALHSPSRAVVCQLPPIRLCPGVTVLALQLDACAFT